LLFFYKTHNTIHVLYNRIQSCVQSKKCKRSATVPTTVGETLEGIKKTATHTRYDPYIIPFLFFRVVWKKNSTRYYRGFCSRTIKTNVITLAIRSTREQYEFPCVPIYYIMYKYIKFVREESVRYVSHLTTAW